MTNRERIKENFMNLVSIDAASFQERAMATEIITRLTRLGFSVSEDQGNRVYNSQVGNIYGFLKGTLPGEPLLFSAHLDTVEPSKNKQAQIDQHGKITSVGETVLGADDIAGIVEILEAAESIIENNIPHRDMEVFFPFAEESFLKGSEVADYSKIISKEAYILDLEGEIGTFAIQAPTVVAFTATIQGKAAHAGFAPEKGIHAIKAMADVIADTQLGILDQDTRMNIGTIQGGFGKNIIPPDCSIQGEIRSLVHEKAIAQLVLFEDKLKAISKKYGTEYTLESEAPCIAYKTEESEEAVVKFTKVCKKLGLESNAITTFGGSDNNNFAKHGIKGIVLACGMHQVHSTKEYTYLHELEKVSEIIYLLLSEEY